jgi:hypothetical protein
MWHKEYYKLDEAAMELEADTILLLDVMGRFNAELDDKEAEWLAQDDDCFPKPNPYDEYFRLFTILDGEQSKRISKDVFSRGAGESISEEELQLLMSEGNIESLLRDENEAVHVTHDEMWGIATEIFRHDIAKIITAIENHNEVVSVYLKTAYSLDNDNQVVGSQQTKEDVKLSQIAIRNHDLKRLLALKAEHDGKPTAEQLQQQLDEAKARIAELEAKQSTDTKQPIQQQREQALLFWVEGVGRDVVMTMPKAQIRDALKRIDPIFRFSDFEKFWQKQKVIKLEAGKPTRNIG